MATASASYFVVVQTADGQVTQWMWNCDNCPVAGLATTERQVVEDMNAHVTTKHPRDDYTATPVPE